MALSFHSFFRRNTKGVVSQNTPVLSAALLAFWMAGSFETSRAFGALSGVVIVGLIAICGFVAASLMERINDQHSDAQVSSTSTLVLAVALPLTRAPWARGCATLPEIVDAMERIKSDYVFIDADHVASLSGAGSGNSVVLTKVPFFSSTTSVSEALSVLRTTGSAAGVVLDASGVARWFVSLDEVLEQTLFDAGEIPALCSDQPVEVDGWVTIERLARMSFSLPRGEWRSIGGLLSAKAGRVPEVGFSIDLHPYRVTVKNSTHRAVTRVVLENLS